MLRNFAHHRKAISLPASPDALKQCMFGVGVIAETLMVVGGKATHTARGCGSIMCTGEQCCPGCSPAKELPEVEEEEEEEEDDDDEPFCVARDGQLWCGGSG